MRLLPSQKVRITKKAEKGGYRTEYDLILAWERFAEEQGFDYRGSMKKW